MIAQYRMDLFFSYSGIEKSSSIIWLLFKDFKIHIKLFSEFYMFLIPELSTLQYHH